MTKANWEIDGTMASAQRTAIVAALQASSFGVSEAARILGIGRSTLYRLMRVYKIAVPELHVDTDVYQSSPKTGGRANGQSKSKQKVEAPKVIFKDGFYYLAKDRAK